MLSYLDEHHLLERLIAASRLNPDCFIELCTQVCANQMTALSVSVSDQMGRKDHDSLRRALSLLERERVGKSTTLWHRHLGVISHQAAIALLRHQPLPGNRYTAAPLLAAARRRSSEGQTPLLDWDDEDFAPAVSLPPVVTRSGCLRQVHVGRLDRELYALEASVNGRSRRATIKRLARHLEPLVGNGHVETVLHGKLGQVSLRELTLASWAQLALFTANLANPLVIDELPILTKDYWLSGGRVDALLFVDEDGQLLRGRHRQRIEQALTRKPKSLAELAQMIPELGQTVFLEIIDFKFQVGDAVGNFSVLRPEEVSTSPLPGHANQLRLYLAKSQIAYRRGRGLQRTPWGLPFVRRGQLWYIFNNRPPIVHSIECTADERRDQIEQLRAQRDQLEQVAELKKLAHTVIRRIRSPQSQLTLDL